MGEQMFKATPKCPKCGKTGTSRYNRYVTWLGEQYEEFKCFKDLGGCGFYKTERLKGNYDPMKNLDGDEQKKMKNAKMYHRSKIRGRKIADDLDWMGRRVA